MLTLPVFITIGMIVPVILSPLLLLSTYKVRKSLFTIIISILAFLAIYNLTNGLGTGFIQTSELNLGKVLNFSAHPYNRIMLFGFTFVGSLALWFGYNSLTAQEKALAVWAVVSAIGVSLASNFITLFLFWELLTLSVAGIIIIGAAEKQKTYLGLRFLYMHIVGGLLMLAGILLHFAETESFAIQTPENGLIFFIIAIAVKSAFLPLHIWVAWSYPTANLAASVLLSGLTTKVGVYAIARILPPHEGIVLMGATMALMGITCALLQSNLRNLLSFHIISQVGYMVAGVGLGTSLAVDGGMLHIVNHMLYKALLFMSAGSLLYSLRTENIKELIHEHDQRTTNVYRVIPVAFIGALFGSLSISGIPPFNGFVSKYLLKTAFEGAGIFQWMLLLASLGTAASFSKFVYLGFIKGKGQVKYNLPSSMKFAILVASAFTLILGIFPKLMSQQIPYSSSLEVYSLPGIQDALLLGLGGIVIFYLIRNPLQSGVHIPDVFSADYIITSTFRTVYSSMELVMMALTELYTDDIPVTNTDITKSGDSEEKHTAKLTNLNLSWLTIKNINFDQLLVLMVLIVIITTLTIFASNW